MTSKFSPNPRAVLQAKDDAGVSAVIGSVLMFGLLSSAFVMWSFTTLPVWIADNEEARNLDVEHSFATLKSGLDLLAIEGTGLVTASFPLAADEVPLLQPAPSSGELGYQEGFTWDATFTGATSHMVDGAVDGTPSFTINGVADTNIASLEVLQIAINGGDGSTVTLTATDSGSGSVVGIISIATGNSNCADAILTFTITSSFTSGSRTNSECVVNTLADYLYNPMTKGRGFASQLNRLDGAFDLQITQTLAPSTTFGAIWVDGNGLTQSKGTGTSCSGTDCNRSVSGGRMVFNPLTFHAIDQDVVWEGGSILRSQSDGAMVVSAPDFDIQIDSTNNIGYLRWTVVELEGTGALGGAGSANAVLTYRGVDERLVETNGDENIVLGSSYSKAWKNFLNSEIQVAGADASTTVVHGTDQVTLSLLTSGDVTKWFVEYRVISASVVVGG